MDKKPKILLVDDDELLLEAIGAAIKWAGMEIETLEFPRENFLEIVERANPDLVLLDLYIKNVSGLDLCRNLKKNPKTSGIPVIIFTSSTEKIDKIASEDAGATDYIIKPVDVKILLAKIHSHLKK
jgi:DNA-binding response OmpR family regulator